MNNKMKLLVGLVVLGVFEKILRDFSGEWEFSDYNQSIQIQQPQEALNAQSAGN